MTQEQRNKLAKVGSRVRYATGGLRRQAKKVTSSGRDVKILKAVIREAIAQLRN